MPNMPCWADIAARDYAADPQEAKQRATDALAEEIDTDWHINALRARLTPSECEALDDVVAAVAGRILEERAADNFVEPDWD